MHARTPKNESRKTSRTPPTHQLMHCTPSFPMAGILSSILPSPSHPYSNLFHNTATNPASMPAHLALLALLSLLTFPGSIIAAEGEQGVVEALYRGPLLVLPPSPPSSPHLPPAGHLWTVTWQDDAQGYKLSSSSLPLSTGGRMLAHGTLSDASVDVSGWWQLAIATSDLDLDQVEGKGRGHKTGKRERSHGRIATSTRFEKENDEDDDTAWMLRRWYSAGLLEGYVTAPLIAEYALNAKHSLFDAHHFPR